MKNFGKYLILILAFFSISESLAYTSTEVKEDISLTSEDLRAANISLFAFRENPFQEISDFSKKTFSTDISIGPDYLRSATTPSEGIDFIYVRDLRKNISQQLFPKHFFL